MDKLQVTLPVSSKRVVLLHTNGPHAGLHQILGPVSDFEGQTPPSYIEDFQIDPARRRGAASLIAAKPSFLLYREVPLQADGEHYPVRVR